MPSPKRVLANENLRNVAANNSGFWPQQQDRGEILFRKAVIGHGSLRAEPAEGFVGQIDEAVIYERKVLPRLARSAFEIGDNPAKNGCHIDAVTAVAQPVIDILESSDAADGRGKINGAVHEAAPCRFERNSRQRRKNPHQLVAQTGKTRGAVRRVTDAIIELVV